MAQTDTTCWTIIQAAAEGSPGDCEAFARRYAPVARAYLTARWRSSPCLNELDDATQEVFVECFKRGGVLDRAERSRPGGFRAFFYGVVRNVARRLEKSRAQALEQQQPRELDWEQIGDEEARLSNAFERAWAKTLLREAGRVQEERARSAGEAALRRVELLRLRFHDGLKIREIAARWQVDAAVLHHEYARARQEFAAALRAVVAFHQPGSPEAVEQECANLLAILG
jgi:RNA polymerase sigma-70 factor (ECF subfamily)